MPGIYFNNIFANQELNKTNTNTCSISVASGTGNNGLRRRRWSWATYISISYFSPTIALIAIIENLAILSVLCRLKTRIAESARVYYMPSLPRSTF